MKILFITKYKNKTTWFELWKEELSQQEGVYFYGKNYPDCRPLEKITESFLPDVIVVGGLVDERFITGLNEIDIPKVCMLLDFNILYKHDPEVKYQGSIFYPNYLKLLQNYRFDSLLAFYSDIGKFLPEYDIKILTLPFSSKHFFDGFGIRDIDIMTSAGTDSWFYPCRKGINRFIKSFKDLKVLIKHLEFETYADYLRRAKIFVNSGNRYVNDVVSLKYLEAMASGTLFLTTKPVNLEQYGFLENRHLVFYSTFGELKEKIRYYLNNESVMRQITEEAKWYVKDRFTNEINILTFLDELKCLIK